MTHTLNILRIAYQATEPTQYANEPRRAREYVKGLRADVASIDVAIKAGDTDTARDILSKSESRLHGLIHRGPWHNTPGSLCLMRGIVDLIASAIRAAK